MKKYLHKKNLFNDDINYVYDYYEIEIKILLLVKKEFLIV